MKKNQKYPLVTIVTPSYNQSDFIGDTLESVLKQDYQNIEHIVIDGGSDDGTINVLKSYEDKYNLIWTSEKDDGQSHAINKGFEVARGEFVYWLNSDDVLLFNSSITDIVNLFKENPKFDIIYGNRIVIDDQNNLIKVQYTNRYKKQSILSGITPLYQENVFFRKEVIKTNKIDTNLHVVMDTDYWIRLSNQYKLLYVNKIFASFRIHSSNKTVSDEFSHKWNKEKDYLRDTYGAKRFKINQGSQPLRYVHRFRSFFKGTYNNYIFLPFDVIKIRYNRNLSVPIKIKIALIPSYVLNSLRPYTR